MSKAKTSRWKTATGLFQVENRLVVAQVAKTPVGTRQLDTIEVELGEGGAATALADLNANGRIQGRLVFGLDPRGQYSITRRLAAEDAESSPAELLADRLGNLEGGLVAGKADVKLPKGPHTHLVACSRAAAAELLSGVEVPRMARLAPVSLALLREAQSIKRLPRRWKTSIVIFHGEENGMALLVHGNHLLAASLYDTALDGDASVDSTVLGLLSYARHELELGGVDGVQAYVGEAHPDLVELLEEELDLTVRVAPSLTYDDHAVACALARLALQPQGVEIDLFDDLRPAGGLRENFPARATAFLGAVVLCSGGFLYTEAVALEADVEQTKGRSRALAARVGLDISEVEPKHELLKAEVTTATAFAVNRVFMEDLLREVPELLPRKMTLTRLDARDVVTFRKATSAVAGNRKKQFQIFGEVPVRPGVTTPPEASQLTASIQESELFQASFPKLTGANIRLTQGANQTLANIVVLCLPQGK